MVETRGGVSGGDKEGGRGKEGGEQEWEKGMSSMHWATVHSYYKHIITTAEANYRNM